MRKLAIILIALTLIIGGLFAQANLKGAKVPAGRAPSENPDYYVTDRLTPIDEGKSLQEMLLLTPKQTEKIEEIKTALQKQMNIWIAQHQNLRLDKQKAMQSRDFEGAKKVTGQMFDLKKTMANARIDAFKAIYNEMTAGQKAVIEENCGRDGNGIGALLGGRMCGDGFRQRRGYRGWLQERPESGLQKAGDLNRTPTQPSTVK